MQNAPTQVSFTMTRNDYEGETPEQHDASLFIVSAKGDAKMNDKERNLQHAMMSFALWGGMLVNSRHMPSNAGRVVSHPSNFVPYPIKKR